MASKKEPAPEVAAPEFVAHADGYGLTPDGVWAVLPAGYVIPDPA